MADGITTKICKACNVEKEIACFGVAKAYAGGHRHQCRPCRTEESRKWANSERGQKLLKDYREVNRETIREKRLKKYVDESVKRHFQITEEVFNQLLAQQGGGCGICGRLMSNHGRRRMVVDHCHTDGRVRGILCMKCNVGIGQLGDTDESIRRAFTYMQSAYAREPVGRGKITRSHS